MPFADAVVLAHPPVVAVEPSGGGAQPGMAGVALATVQPWGERVPRRLLLLAAWYGLGTGLILYGGLSLVFDALRAARVLPASEATLSGAGVAPPALGSSLAAGRSALPATGEASRRWC